MSAPRTSPPLGIAIVILLLLTAGCFGGPEKKPIPPGDHGTRVTLDNAERLIAQNKPALARRLLEDLASPIQPASVRGEARLALGRCALIENRSEEALTHLQQAFKLLRRHPLGPTAELLLGEACLRSKAYTLAVNHLIGAYRFLNAEKDQIRAAFLITRILSATGQPVPERYSTRSRGASFPEYDPIWQYLEAPGVSPVPAVARLPEAKPAPTTEPTPGRISTFSRRSWGAGTVIQGRTLPLGIPKKITIHHTADQAEMLSLAGRDTRQYLKRLQNHYQKNRKYADLPYHFIISMDGKIWEGRSIRYQGAHAGNNILNKGNIGIALVGDFDRQVPSRSQGHSLKALIASLCSRFHLDAGDVFGHGDLKSTDCPGKHLRRMLPQFTQQLAADLKSKPPR